jgi:2-methylisocitrate lyase-like PEP mutase family enzyme
MPNPWDVGSARLLESAGFEALATTSAGFAWSLGRRDQNVSRNELVAHVAALAAATDLPLNVDSERCYPDDLGGVTRTVELLREAGAAGFSIEDYNPDTGSMDDVAAAAERVAEAAEASRRQEEPMVLTGRAENHIRGVDDLDDTIARLIAYRAAGADVVYAPGLTDLDQIARVVEAVRIPLNVLA